MNNATMELIESVLARIKKDWEITENDIDEIILVGGSTRMLKTKALLRERFGGKQLFNVNQDEIVAMGAAILAASLARDPAPVLQNLILVDVTPLSLGIETDAKGENDGLFTKIIERNRETPALEVYDKLWPMHADQTSVVFPVGEVDGLPDIFEL